jgi:hypothetical protein
MRRVLDKPCLPDDLLHELLMAPRRFLPCAIGRRSGCRRHQPANLAVNHQFEVTQMASVHTVFARDIVSVGDMGAASRASPRHEIKTVRLPVRA